MRAPRFAGRDWIEAVLTIVTIAVAIGFYAWTVRLAGGFQRGDPRDYHTAVVEGWLGGHLHLGIEPAPELLRLSDPYDPALNGPYRLPDASLFQGHYYLYFGAAPAVTLMLPWRLVTGQPMSTSTAVFVFCALALTAAACLLWLVRRRLFADAPSWVVPLGILVVAFGTHLMALARRPMWWELPIAAELAFLTMALLAAVVAFFGASPARRALTLASVGLLLGLAFASRPIALVPTIAIGGVIIVTLWRKASEDDSHVRGAALGALLFGGCVAAVGWYNYDRFGDPLEFGQRYQLSAMYEAKLTHFAGRYVPPNLQTYFFQLPHAQWQFPFIKLWTRSTDIPGYVDGEEMCGLFTTFPILLFSMGALVALARGVDLRRRALVAALFAWVLPVAVLLLSFFSATERYAAEFGFPLGVLATVGCFTLTGSTASRAWRVAAITLGTASAVAGALASFDYHGAFLSRDNPSAWERIGTRADALVGRVGLMLGQFSGPRVLKVRFRERPVGTIETLWRSTSAVPEERIVVEHMAAYQIRLGYQRDRGVVTWGGLLSWEPHHTHTVEVQLPSLYGRRAGALRGFRRGYEYQERTLVAVTFSGGRALSLVVPPLARTGGTGEVPPDFAGEVRANRTRLLLANELPQAPFPNDRATGVLTLDVQFPSELRAEGEPIVVLGERYGSDMLVARESAGVLRLAFEHYGAPEVVSESLSLDRTQRHQIAIQSPALASGAFGTAREGTVAVTVDGRTVLRWTGALHPFAPESARVGSNPCDTTCARRFSGWVLRAAWGK